VIGDEDTVALLAASSTGPPQPPPQPRDPRPELLADERQRLANYHQRLRTEMEQRHARERAATTNPSAGTESPATLHERQNLEIAVFEDQRQREVEALRRRQREERDRFAARQKPLSGFAPPGLQQTKIYDLPPEWQLPSDLMQPPPSRSRPPAARR
jgi:hypothetical protein